jgi:hypothetical protein
LSAAAQISVAAGTAAATAGAYAAHNGKLPLPPLDGALRFDEASRATAADDFGHTVHRTPEGVLLPRSDQDVATTIRWAGGRGRKIAPQGQSHSVYGRSQVRAGIVIAMTARCVLNLHEGKSHDYEQHTGGRGPHPRPHRTLGQFVRKQDIDGVLVDHAEDMVM